MASSKEYLAFVREQLSSLPGVSHRAMMGEYILYCSGRVAGGIYDDRLLIKPVRSALELMPGAKTVFPYEGSKGMLLVEDVDDREFLETLFTAIYADLPEPKKKKPKKGILEWQIS